MQCCKKEQILPNSVVVRSPLHRHVCFTGRFASMFGQEYPCFAKRVTSLSLLFARGRTEQTLGSICV